MDQWSIITCVLGPFLTTCGTIDFLVDDYLGPFFISVGTIDRYQPTDMVDIDRFFVSTDRYGRYRPISGYYQPNRPSISTVILRKCNRTDRRYRPCCPVGGTEPTVDTEKKREKTFVFSRFFLTTFLTVSVFKVGIELTTGERFGPTSALLSVLAFSGVLCSMYCNVCTGAVNLPRRLKTLCLIRTIFMEAEQQMRQNAQKQQRPGCSVYSACRMRGIGRHMTVAHRLAMTEEVAWKGAGLAIV